MITNRSRILLIALLTCGIFVNGTILSNSMTRIFENTASMPIYGVAIITTIITCLLGLRALIFASKMIEFSDGKNYFIIKQNLPKNHAIITDQKIIKVIGWACFSTILFVDTITIVSLASHITLWISYSKEEITTTASILLLLNLINVLKLVMPFAYMTSRRKLEQQERHRQQQQLVKQRSQQLMTSNSNLQWVEKAPTPGKINEFTTEPPQKKSWWNRKDKP